MRRNKRIVFTPSRSGFSPYITRISYTQDGPSGVDILSQNAVVPQLLFIEISMG